MNLPDTPYYREHADRFDRSFAMIPPIPAGGSVLLVGSWGAEACELRARGASICSAIRAPADGVLPVEEIDGITLYAFDVESDWPPVGQFDLVLMWEVLEHLCREPTSMLFHAIRATKIGGHLSLTTPNALWHVFTMAHLSGVNALGTQLQLHIPFATHWRLWSPSEVAECFRAMGCETTKVTSIVRDKPWPTIKSKLFVRAIEFLRRHSGNGECSVGQHVLVNVRKVSQPHSPYRPTWLFPNTTGVS